MGNSRIHRIKEVANRFANMALVDMDITTERYIGYCKRTVNDEWSTDEIVIITQLIDIYFAAMSGWMERPCAKDEQNRVIKLLYKEHCEEIRVN